MAAEPLAMIEQVAHVHELDQTSVWLDTIRLSTCNSCSIAEGHAFVGSNLVLGQAMTSNGTDMFVTFVGQLDLDQATQAANSVVGLQAQ